MLNYTNVLVDQCEIQIWLPAKPSNKRPLLQVFQFISVRLIMGAPWFVTGEPLGIDL